MKLLNDIHHLATITGCTLLLAACGEQAAAPRPAVAAAATTSSGRVPDACAVLTDDDIAKALGVQLDRAVHESLPRPHCSYRIGDGSVVVYVFSDASAKGGYVAGKNIQAAYSTAVPGIGNDAYWSQELKVLNVLKGNVYFTVQFLGLGSASLDAAKLLAQKAAERLP